MNYSPVVLLLLIAMATSHAQRKCCLPDQFTAVISEVVGSVQGGKGSVVESYYQMAFDYTDRRLASFTYKGTTKYQTIVDYIKEREYMIQIGPEASVCIIQPLPPKTAMMHCIPDNATYGGSGYFGNRQLNVDFFSYYLPGVGNTSVIVSTPDCIPFALAVQGQVNAVPTLKVVGYVNYTRGISDSGKYFDVPAFCSQTMSEEKLQGIDRRFHRNFLL